jgi:hypothetical protein
MRFNHMELTFPIGSLTTTLREEIDGFYGSIFGWKGLDTDVVGRPATSSCPTRTSSSSWRRANER